MDQSQYNANTIDSGCESCSMVSSDTLIASDVKFNNSPLEAETKPKRHRNDSEIITELEKKQEEEYNNEAYEQKYKQLMHLLNKSKFYSSYLINKIEENKHKKEKITKKRKDPPINDENVSPEKKKNKVNVEEYINIEDIEEFLSTEMKKQLHTSKRKKNLNVEDIDARLSTDSDTEEEPEVTANSTVISKYFCGELYEYQQAGLEWLKLLYENALSGILADEMGLGKTIQVIALMCHLIEKKQAGPYLIIVPLSTVPHWLAEFKKFAPAIPVVLLYGTLHEREAIRIKIKCKHHVANGYRMQPVVITTYEVPLRETKFLQSQTWKYIIVDEGHRIKNYNCKLVKLLKTVRSMNRLILTGTPLQNNLSELWSLLNFLLPQLFDDLDTFESWFDVKELQHQHGTEKLLKQEEEKHVLSTLREILKPFMLRRIKADVDLEIPPKKELIVYSPLTELQHDLYKAVLNYDLKMLSKIETPDPIIQTINGERPKRQCVLRRKFRSVENQSENRTLQDTSLKEIENNNDIDECKEIKFEDQNNLLKWKQYTDVTERNRDYLISIHGHRRFIMYKKIVNHPYLIHCPLDSSGLPKVDEDLVRSSGKLLVLDAMLAKLKRQGHKVLLFSTMTTILDMIENYLSLRDYSYVRLDGRTKMENREKNINIFNNDLDMFLFLITTRAGGVGLNLIGADTVIIYDSDWNPQSDIQAMARCHRIGQTKPVIIYRLCTRGTIDEAIIKRSEAKRILEKMVISEVLNKSTLLHLRELIMSKDYKIVTSEKEVFTEAELNKLLDRSDMMINNHRILKNR